MSGGSDLTIRVSALKFAHRELHSEDLAECFGFDAAHMGNELVGFPKALEVWKRLAECRAFRGIAIEASPLAGVSVRIVGFGARVFVARHFVDSEIENPRPGIHARLIARLHTLGFDLVAFGVDQVCELAELVRLPKNRHFSFPFLLRIGISWSPLL